MGTEESKKIWEENAQFWDNAMGDESNEFHREVVRPKVTELLSPNPADYILDIACGNGNYPKITKKDVDKKWTPHYPAALKRWSDNWDVITPIFKFSTDVRTAFYTTNAIESLNSSYRRLNSQRSVFPSQQALLKALYLATFEATKKWSMPIRNWGKVRGELTIMYPDRL